MYLNFYGLKEKPFNTTPDPKFLYLTPSHSEALAQILYGVQESKGFIVLTGEIGTGKTTLLQTLLRRLNGGTEAAFIFNSKLPFNAILEYMLKDFGIDKNARTRAQRLFALNNFLIERRRSGQNTVLIIDEAQNLEPPDLEQVRLLSNFETPTEKLLQILLVGQPELKAKLDLPELRQLKQRIALRCSIRPLAAGEVLDYIKHRLRIAGAGDLGLFTDPAVSRISEYTEGNPRLVNIICDHCLLFAYADQQRRVDQETVVQAIEYLDEGKKPERRGAGKRLWSGGGPLKWLSRALAAVVALAIFITLGFHAVEYIPATVESYFLQLARSLYSMVAFYLSDATRYARELMVAI